MVKIILEGHNFYSVSIPKKDIYSLDFKDKYHARMLIDVKSEICCTQIQFVSYESKSVYWSKDELLIAFNKVYEHIKLFVETDGPIRLFDENLFHPETKELQTDELKEDFQIEIPENKENIRKMSDGLLRIKDAQNNFDKCKNKLFVVINWGPDLLNRYRYNINRVIDYLDSVANAGVVTDSNNENLRHIMSAFDELGRRKNTQNDTYQKTLDIAKREIYTLEFPKYFKTDLPQNEISQVLDEIY
jgi:hypothetical protein